MCRRVFEMQRLLQDMQKMHPRAIDNRNHVVRCCIHTTKLAYVSSV
jgi:hypothetical protein